MQFSQLVGHSHKTKTVPILELQKLSHCQCLTSFKPFSPRHPSLSVNVYVVYKYNLISKKYAEFNNTFTDPRTKFLTVNIHELIKISNKTATSSARGKGQLFLLTYPLPHIQLW
jgi:hypothetical protein